MPFYTRWSWLITSLSVNRFTKDDGLLTSAAASGSQELEDKLM